MAESEFVMTPQEQRELMITVRQTQSDVASLKETVRDMHRIVAGNGDYGKSLVGRVHTVEERQVVGTSIIAEKQDEMCKRLIHIESILNEHSVYLSRNHNRIADLEIHDASQEKRLGTLEKLIEATKNKAVGIGIGVGVGTSIGIFGVTKFFEWLSTVIPLP